MSVTCRASHNGSDNAVRANDVFFALHALLLTCLTLGQIGIYDRGSQRVSTLCIWAVGSAMAFIIVYAGKYWLLENGFAPCRAEPILDIEVGALS